MTVLAEEIDPLALERQVCFALAATNRAVLAVYRPLLEPLGLTHPQYLVMLALWDHHRAGNGDKPLSVKQIAASLQLDSATLSPMLKRLEALGLITRTRSAFDERATDIAWLRRAIDDNGISNLRKRREQMNGVRSSSGDVEADRVQTRMGVGAVEGEAQ